MKKSFKILITTFLSMVLMFMLCLSTNAVKYVDGRFVKNIQLQECMKKIVKERYCYKELDDSYSIYAGRMCFSFAVGKKSQMIKDITIIIPVIHQSSVVSFYIDLYPKKKISSLELVRLFLSSNEFSEQDYNFDYSESVSLERWEPDHENEYDNKYSIMTDITEDNWQQKFSGEEEDGADPEHCPESLMFFELQPGEKVFVEGVEV